jgi:hypothetical protein
MKLSIDELPPMPKMSGGGRKSDTKNWLKDLVSMFEDMEIPEFPMPIVPPLPLMPPMLPMAPWGFWGKKSSKDEHKDKSYGASSRDFMETMNEFTENANKYAREQADLFFNFFLPGQKKTKETTSKTVKRTGKEASDNAADDEE